MSTERAIKTLVNGVEGVVLEVFWCTLILVVLAVSINLWEVHKKRKEDERWAKFEAKHGSCNINREE